MKQNKNALGFSGKSLQNKVCILNTDTLVVLLAYKIINLAEIWRGKYVMKTPYYKQDNIGFLWSLLPVTDRLLKPS